MPNGGRGRGGHGGGGGNPRWDLKLVQTSIEEGKGKVQANLFKGTDPAPDNTEISFSINDQPLGQVKTAGGKAEIEFELPTGATTGKLHAEVLAAFGPSRDLIVTTKAKAVQQEQAEFALHSDPPIRVSEGEYRIYFDVRDSNGRRKKTDTKMEVVGSNQFTFSDGQGRNEDHNKDRFEVNIPAAGTTLTFKILKARKLRLVFELQEINDKRDLLLIGPKRCARVVGMDQDESWIAKIVSGWQGFPGLRLLFAWIPLWLGLVCIFGSWGSTLIMTLVVIGLFLAIKGLGWSIISSRVKQGIGWIFRRKTVTPPPPIPPVLPKVRNALSPIFRTNNLTWFSVAGFFLVCTLILGVMAFAAPAPVVSANPTQSLDTQRMDNLVKFGEYKTDEEMGKAGSSWFPKLLSLWPDQSTTAWDKRFVAFVFFLIYVVFSGLFAFWDEIGEVMIRHEGELRDEGARSSWIVELLKRVYGTPKNPPKPTGSKILREGVAHLVLEGSRIGIIAWIFDWLYDKLTRRKR